MSLISFSVNESLPSAESFPPLPAEFYAPSQPSQKLGILDFVRSVALVGLVLIWASYSKLTA